MPVSDPVHLEPLNEDGKVSVSVAEFLADSRDSWRVGTISSVDPNMSSVQWIVPANTEYQILSIFVTLATTATAGNRQLVVQALDSTDDVILSVRAGLTQGPGVTRTYQFGPGLVQDVAFRDTDYASVALLPILLAPGQKLRVRDSKAIDAAADDMTIFVQVASRSVA